MATINDRDYLVGSTVRLKVSVREPGGGAPLDPPTPPTLVHLVSAGVALALPTTVAFTKVTPGQYVLSLQTVGYAPGVYSWRAQAVDANSDVALSEDAFVLRATT